MFLTNVSAATNQAPSHAQDLVIEEDLLHPHLSEISTNIRDQIYDPNFLILGRTTCMLLDVAGDGL